MANTPMKMCSTYLTFSLLKMQLNALKCYFSVNGVPPKIAELILLRVHKNRCLHNNLIYMYIYQKPLNHFGQTIRVLGICLKEIPVNTKMWLFIFIEVLFIYKFIYKFNVQQHRFG